MQAARQLQVGLLVETCAQLDDRGDFLTIARCFHQSIDDFRVGARAIQRLLDRQHAGILRRLTQQVDHRREGLEGVQQQDVLLGDDAEDVLAVLQQLRDRRGEGRVLQLRMAVQAGDAEQPREIDRAVDAVQLALAQAELLEQEVGQVLRAGIGHLQAHRIAIAPGNQLAPQRPRQVLDILGIHRKVGVARQAELIATLDPHAVEQIIGVGMDHRREENEVVALAAHRFRHADHPRQQARRRNDGQPRIAAEGIDAFQLDDEVEALVDQQWERMRRIEADRGDDRRDLVTEVATHPGLELDRPVATANEADLVLGQLRQQHLIEDRVLPVHLLVHQLGNPCQRLMRLQAVGTRLLAGEGNLLLQAGDTDLEEFVEVAGEDQQELQPLQRVGLVQRLLQHADVELQLRQLAVNVQAAVIQVRHRGRNRDRCFFHHLDWQLRLHLHQRRLLAVDVLQLRIAESLTVHQTASGGLTALVSIVVPPVWRSR